LRCYYPAELEHISDQVFDTRPIAFAVRNVVASMRHARGRGRTTALAAVEHRN